jgi:hypothetical protein
MLLLLLLLLLLLRLLRMDLSWVLLQPTVLLPVQALLLLLLCKGVRCRALLPTLLSLQRMWV